MSHESQEGGAELTDMHQHPELHRRADDNHFAARVAYSPLANLAHMSATLGLLVTVLGFGAQFYSTVETNKNQTNNNMNKIVQVEKTAVKLSSRVSRIESKVGRNTKDIDRVEAQASQDRIEIIRRLEALNTRIGELNRYLRDQKSSKEYTPRPEPPQAVVQAEEPSE